MQRINLRIPIEIANIIAALEIRQLSFGEKRSLLIWYNQLTLEGKRIISTEDETVLEERIFRNIENHINKRFRNEEK